MLCDRGSGHYASVYRTSVAYSACQLTNMQCYRETTGNILGYITSSEVKSSVGADIMVGIMRHIAAIRLKIIFDILRSIAISSLQ